MAACGALFNPVQGGFVKAICQGGLESTETCLTTGGLVIATAQYDSYCA
jgi:hypothetical protein